MNQARNYYLIIGAGFSGVAALLHSGCIVIGAECYRRMGAGEQMAQMALSGHWYPKTVTATIAAVLLVWALYALSGAGVIRKLPLVRLALCVITAIYLLRGIAFAPLQDYFPGNSTLFWITSSGICLAMGVIHFLGVRKAWSRL